MNDNLFEIKWRKELIKRIEYPMRQLIAAMDKEKQKTLKRTQKLEKYETCEDAQEAYEYGDITIDELDRIKDLFDGIKHNPEKTITEAASDELWDFIRRLRSDIRSFEWEMLPDEEKERIKRETAERHDRNERKRIFT